MIFSAPLLTLTARTYIYLSVYISTVVFGAVPFVRNRLLPTFGKQNLVKLSNIIPSTIGGNIDHG